MDRVNESTGYAKSQAEFHDFLLIITFLGIFGSTLWETWDL